MADKYNDAKDQNYGWANVELSAAGVRGTEIDRVGWQCGEGEREREHVTALLEALSGGYCLPVAICPSSVSFLDAANSWPDDDHNAIRFRWLI